MKVDIEMLDNKLELIQWLASLEDKAVINRLIQFRNEETNDWWSEISDSEKKSIELGIKDADNKKLTPHSSVRKLYEKWL